MHYWWCLTSQYAVRRRGGCGRKKVSIMKILFLWSLKESVLKLNTRMLFLYTFIWNIDKNFSYLYSSSRVFFCFDCLVRFVYSYILPLLHNFRDPFSIWKLGEIGLGSKKKIWEKYKSSQNWLKEKVIWFTLNAYTIEFLLVYRVCIKSLI